MWLHRHKETLARVFASVVALGLAANTAAPALSQTPDPGDRMNVWAGRWKEVVALKETIYSHAATIPSQVSCAWSGDRGYMVCEYVHDTTDALSIFSYDAKNQTYKHVGIANGVLSSPEAIPVVLDGNLWRYTYQGSTKSGAKVDVRDSYEFVTPEKRITHIEISSDGGQHWVLVSEEVGIKIS